LEVLEPLDELGEDISLEKSYLQALEILSNSSIDETSKITSLLEIYHRKHELNYLIFDYLFRIDPKIAWKNLDLSKSELITELLWRCKKQDLNLDIIAKSSFLSDLYSARGDVNISEGSDLFELDILINLKGRANATLNFEYICSECKSVSPFAFSRCSVCHTIDSAQVEWSLSRDYTKVFDEENNSFQ